MILQHGLRYNVYFIFKSVVRAFRQLNDLTSHHGSVMRPWRRPQYSAADLNEVLDVMKSRRVEFDSFGETLAHKSRENVCILVLIV